MYNILMQPLIAIIGAGPAGMTAALHAAQSGAQVVLLEANTVPGRKLLVSGSGRANLTNRNVCAAAYACADTAWMETLLAGFGHTDLLRFLEELGVLTCSTSDGWFYPISDSAQTVVNAFAAALQKDGIDFLPGAHVSAIRKSKDGFTLAVDGRGELTCSRLIVAAGGKAYPALGSKGELFPALKSLGHTVLPLTPALAPVTCNMKDFHRLQGVRLDAQVSLVRAQRAVAVGAIHESPLQRIVETTGNIIFTEWGLNGPGVMDLSHHIARQPETSFELTLNFLPGHENQVRELVQQHRREAIPLSVLPGGSLPPKLALFLIERAGLRPQSPLADMDNAKLENLLRLMTSLTLQVTGVRGFEYCQVSAGGVPVTEVDPQTMQSRRVPGLYLVGETLDVVGPCGGYNLQFAFSSGAVAGTAAARP